MALAFYYSWSCLINGWNMCSHLKLPVLVLCLMTLLYQLALSACQHTVQLEMGTHLMDLKLMVVPLNTACISFWIPRKNMKPLSVEMACILGIQQEIQAACLYTLLKCQSHLQSQGQGIYKGIYNFLLSFQFLLQDLLLTDQLDFHLTHL